MKKVCLFLADGFEILEAMSPLDVLRRAGVEVTTVSISEKKLVSSSQKIPVEADKVLSEIDYKDFDMIILPGGYPGYENLCKSQKVLEAVDFFVKEQKFIGAICGAITVLSKSGILDGKNFTCHSSVVEKVNTKNYKKNINIVIDNNLITSPGAGRSIDFAFALARALVPDEKIKEVQKGMELNF